MSDSPQSPPPSKAPIPAWVLPLAFGALALAIFGAGISIPFYSDDFQFVFPTPGERILYFFAHPNPVNDFYRPIQAMVMAAIQSIWGLDTRPLHLLQILLHGGLAYLTYALGGRLGLPLPHRVLAGLFVLISQASALAVLSNDTLAQVLGTLAGVGSLYCLERALEEGRFNIPWVWHSVSLLALSLFSKETSVGFCLLIAALGTWRIFGDWGLTLKKGLVSLSLLGVPYLLVTGAYLFIRSQVVISQARLGDARYQFGLGLNIPKNMALLGGATLSPLSTVDAFVAAKSGTWGVILLMLLFTALFLGVVTYGIWRAKQPALTLALGIAALLAMMPALFLNHVSEAYSYNCLPFIALLVGIGGAESALKPSKLKGVMGAILIAVALANILSIQRKARQMDSIGTRAQAMIEALDNEGDAIPQKGPLILVSGSTPQYPYSVFLIQGFKALRFADHHLREALDRPELEIQFVDEAAFKGEACLSPCSAYAWRAGQLVGLE